MYEITKTQHLVLNMSVIYWINQWINHKSGWNIKRQFYRWSMCHELSEIRMNHARTNTIITVGIAISSAAVRKKSRHQYVVRTTGAFQWPVWLIKFTARTLHSPRQGSTLVSLYQRISRGIHVDATTKKADKPVALRMWKPSAARPCLDLSLNTPRQHGTHTP